MKLLFVTDTHIKGVNPVNRTGNYYKDIMDKIQEVVQISLDKEVDTVLHGGDLYASSLVSNVMVDEFIDLVEDAGIPWHVAVGNHDEICQEWKLSKATTLAHIFRRSKMIKHLDTIETKDTFIKAYGYYHNIEADIKEKGLMCNKKGKTTIAVVHAFITKSKFLPQVLHVPIKEIKSDYDFVLIAHNHNEFGIILQNKTLFTSIGALSRGSIAESDVKRKPKVLLIDTEKQTHNVIILKSAKPAEQVFNLEKVKEKKEFDADMDKFIKELTDKTEIKGIDLRGMVEQIGKEKNIDREILDDAVERIGRYENEL